MRSDSDVNSGGAVYPELADLRKLYPSTVACLGTLADREKWLRKLWLEEERWKQLVAGHTHPREAITLGRLPSNLTIEGEFDIIYSGGILGLLHASIMSSNYQRNVLVFDSEGVGTTKRDWNISKTELAEFERVHLFTAEQIEAAVKNRYTSGFVKFHDSSSRIKTPPLWVNGVLDVAISADMLLGFAKENIRLSPTKSSILDGLKFKRCWVMPDRVVVEVEDNFRRSRAFAARLFIDATCSPSDVYRQVVSEGPVTHVCPSVGTVAKGFASGDGSDKADFTVGEILVSREDAGDHRQLFWEGFPGGRQSDEYATHLFFYDTVDSPADKSLFELFETYFETVGNYKRTGAHWKVIRPVFGYTPGFHDRRKPSDKLRGEDRVLVIGDAAGFSSPLNFCGFGSHVRKLDTITRMIEDALAEDSLDASSLLSINEAEHHMSHMAPLAEFLRPTGKSAPSSVNETANAVMGALQSLDDEIRREFFLERITFATLKNLLARTLHLYPHFVERIRERFGIRGAFWWLADIAEAARKEHRNTGDKRPRM